ncbi:hypothetical protein NX059_009875 [Plenodomus lindquistii]|nr:hypothetical protein NX059_009875 [Plenodomus lindquistii]
MISQDPDYAFIALDKKQIPLRRYIHGLSRINESGVSDMSLPYFKVESIEWLDVANNENIKDFNKASMLKSNLNPGFLYDLGTLAFKVDEQWDYNTAVSYYQASMSEVFRGKRKMSIFVGERNLDKIYPNGSANTQDTPCSHTEDVFGRLPNVTQHSQDVFVADEWKAKRCYMLAEVTMIAGILKSRLVNVTQTTSSYSANIVVGFNHSESETPTGLEPDVSTLPFVDMMSDVARLMTTLNLTHPWRRRNKIDHYVRGVLTSAYIASWSTISIKNATETISMIPNQQVIRAEVSKGRLYIWLAMNSTLGIAAIITAIIGTTVKAKTVRDTTLAAMTLDLGRIAHVNNNGLCNAVSLNKNDRALGRVKWRDSADMQMHRLSGEEGRRGCCKELVLT